MFVFYHVFKLYLFNLKFWCVCVINVLQFLACEV